jgi:1,4-alpha-glucan branching enzyme
MLVLSHDEVVHGKRALLDKMPGDRWQQFANLRMFFAWMWTHPGKKLLFMGGEIGQWKEWNHERGLDWEVLFGREHVGLQTLVRDLNTLYKSTPALHTLDHAPGGFSWLDANDWERSIFTYMRMSPGGDRCYVVVNATPVPRDGYRMGVTEAGPYRELLNTDSEIYCGTNKGNGAGLIAQQTPWQGMPWSVVVTLPPLGTVVIAKA